MTRQPVSLIVPVENQVRELDPKLLVACVAAERGFRVFLGSRTRVDFRIAAFPRAIYLSKSMTPKSAKMFRIMGKLGHEIAALDEEGLVYHSADEYYARRVSDATLGMIATFKKPVTDQPFYYRQLFWESGMIGQMLYLAAEANGVRGTGIGCFFDDAVHEILGLKDNQYQSLYHFTIGKPVDDPRLTTYPPYHHLSR